MTDSGDAPLDRLRAAVRDIPDFPVPGVLFRDITPLLAQPELFHLAIDRLEAGIAGLDADAIVAIESRGFIFGAPLALRLGCAFVPVRKPGKLPFRTVRQDYDLEYGTGSLEAHADALAPGRRAIIVDDVLATGGTAAATASLVERMGARVLGFAFLLELRALDGRARLDRPVHSLLSYEA